MRYFLIYLAFALPTHAQQPATLVSQEVVNGRRVCHYSDQSKITMRDEREACPNPWRLLG